MLASLLHGAVRLASRRHGGSYGRIAPVPRLPERDSLACGAVTLSLLRYHGAGRPLVLLHGLNNNAWCWVRTAALLAGERPILAVSLRGHGRSSAPAQGYALTDTTADLRGLLDRLDAGSVDLAGHSWGGRVALHLAATAPARVHALVLADPVPPRGMNPLLRVPGLVDAALAHERGPFADRARFEAARARVFHLRLGDPIDLLDWEEGFREQPDGSFRHVLPESGYREIVDRALRVDLTPLLHGLRCPVLLLRPTLSVGFWPGEAGQLRRHVPRLAVHRIAGDHTFIHTNPVDTAAAMRQFLDAAAPPRHG
jgi:pimeloyl-ACP methyl ester carboxylesterase